VRYHDCTGRLRLGLGQFQSETSQAHPIRRARQRSVSGLSRLTDSPLFHLRRERGAATTTSTRPCQSNDGQDVHWYWTVAVRSGDARKNVLHQLTTRFSKSAIRRRVPGHLVSAGCNDDYFCGSDAFASTVVFDASAGATVLRIHLDGYNGAAGMASLELEVYGTTTARVAMVRLRACPQTTFGDTRPAT
jgi:hypothetical protein